MSEKRTTEPIHQEDDAGLYGEKWNQAIRSLVRRVQLTKRGGTILFFHRQQSSERFLQEFRDVFAKKTADGLNIVPLEPFDVDSEMSPVLWFERQIRKIGQSAEQQPPKIRTVALLDLSRLPHVMQEDTLATLNVHRDPLLNAKGYVLLLIDGESYVQVAAKGIPFPDLVTCTKNEFLYEEQTHLSP